MQGAHGRDQGNTESLLSSSSGPVAHGLFISDNLHYEAGRSYNCGEVRYMGNEGDFGCFWEAPMNVIGPEGGGLVTNLGKSRRKVAGKCNAEIFVMNE